MRQVLLKSYCQSLSFIIRLEAIASAEYWIYFRGRFGGVHAFGYNSAENEPIWMKSGAL